MGVTDDAFIYKYEIETSVEDNVNQQIDSPIFPNPASDLIEITYPPLERGSGGVNIKIYNIFGQTVLSVGTIHELPLRIDVSTLLPGMYFVRIGDRVSKFVKL
jgi:hypothetical protein